MSKPLELIVYEIDRAEPSMVVVDGFWEYRPHDPAKRLTDAELAAEYWRAKWTGLRAEKHGNCLTDEGRAKIRTVERFYHLPHYDEDPA